MQLFYSKDIHPDSLCTLDADESRHAVRVLRMHEGDSIDVTDGKGHLYRCRVVVADDRACAVEVVDVPTMPTANRPKLCLAVAPTKNPARMEWLVEKAVEMGVEEIDLLRCDHSERTFLKTDRLERLAVSAMKQSLHTCLPPIHPPVDMKQWLQSRHEPLRLIAHCEATQQRSPLGQAIVAGMDTTILIGPEGDFSLAEIEAAIGAGFKPVSLGHSRLRTETAAIYAVAAFNLINDRT